jgi:tetratricopeptide (TPR) repeat protein
MSSPKGTERPAGRRVFGLASALAALLVAGACASATGPMKAGQQAEIASDYDRAVVEYSRAVKEDPDNREAHLALDRAKLRASEMHFTRARRLAGTGKFEEAVIEYELAHELNPTSSDVETELRKARLAVRNKVAVPADGKTQLEALVERTRDMPNSTYELPHDAKLPPRCCSARPAPATSSRRWRASPT